MKTHQDIDKRSLALAEAVVEKIDRDPQHIGLSRARANCTRWLAGSAHAAIAEWQAILQADWEDVRQVLLDPSEHGIRLRQSNPFTGVLTPQERENVFRQFSNE
jgi:hypothetical protein